MSDTSTPARRIRAQGSPRDPLTMRFILDAPVQAGRHASHDSADEVTAPLPRALLALPGVAKLHVAEATVTVTREADADWHSLKLRIAATIRQVLDDTDAPLGDEADAPQAIPMDRAWQLYAARSPETRAAQFYRDSHSALLGNLDRRNHSILAHGFEPIDRKDWEAFHGFFTERLAPILREEVAGGRDLPPQLPTDIQPFLNVRM